MAFAAPQLHHPALFETVRAGDARKVYPSTAARPSPSPSSPNATDGVGAKRNRRAENVEALRRVLFQSLQDNEEVERRILLEREITDRHQVVMLDLSGATNRVYKGLLHGPLRMTVEDRLGLQQHTAAVGTSTTHTNTINHKKAGSANTNANAPLSTRGVTATLQGLSAAERSELRALLRGDVALATGLVDVYKEVLEEDKLRGGGGGGGAGAGHGHGRGAAPATANTNPDSVPASSTSSGRALLVQSLIASMNDVIPADLLANMSMQANSGGGNGRGPPLPTASPASASSSQQQQQQQHLLQPIPTSARQVHDSVHGLYRALGEFYHTIRCVEASYLARKWEAKQKQKQKQKEVTGAVGGRRAPSSFSPSSLPVTPSSLIIVSFFTRLMNMDDPLAHSNYVDRLMTVHRREQRLPNADKDSSNDSGTQLGAYADDGKAPQPFVRRNDFYVLPRQDRFIDFTVGNADGREGGGDDALHMDELFASAAELGTLLMDEAAQVVIEYPEPSSLPYDAYGALGRYNKAEQQRQRPEEAERRSLQGGGGGSVLLLGHQSNTALPHRPSSIVAPPPHANSCVQFSLDLAPSAAEKRRTAQQNERIIGGAHIQHQNHRCAERKDASEEAGYVYPCSLYVVDALPYTAFSSYVRTISGALYPDRSALVSSQLLAMTLLRRVHLLLLV